MPIYYDVHQTRNPNEPEAEEYKAKAVTTATVDLDFIAKEISGRSSFTPGDVKGVVTELIHSIKSHLADSHRVRIDELGSFEVHLTSAAKKKGERMTSSDVVLKGITFRLSKTFIKHWKFRIMSCPASMKKKQKEMRTEEERRAIMDKLLAKEVVITRRDYQAATGLSKATATRDINTYIEKGWLAKKRKGISTLYYLKKQD